MFSLGPSLTVAPLEARFDRMISEPTERIRRTGALRDIQFGEPVCASEGVQSGTWAEGEPILKAFAEFNALIERVNYTDAATAGT